MSVDTDLAFSLDPAAFAEAVGVRPDPWQLQVLEDDHRRLLLNCARQSGKSLVTAILALWTALYGGTRLVVIGAPSLRQSAEMVRTIRELHEKLPEGPELLQTSVTRLELIGGTRIVALPASERTVRGLSGAGLVVLDEAARLPEDVITSVRPMMATVSDARLVVLSTPAGRRGKFYDWWSHGEDWHRVRVTADEVPRISPEFLEAERRELGEMMYRQEYECEFVDDSTAVFSSVLIERAFSAEVVPLGLFG